MQYANYWHHVKDVNLIVQACEEIGVRIKNDDGTYRHSYDVLTDLSKVYTYQRYITVESFILSGGE